jgi:chaperonin cofactor prefoldin
MAGTSDITAFTTTLAQMQTVLSNVLEQCQALSRQIEIISNQGASTAGNVATLASTLSDIEDAVAENASAIDGIPTTDQTTSLSTIVSTQQQISTQLSNIENAILSISSSSGFQEIATQLTAILEAIGIPPEGQDIWSRLSTITTVTTSSTTSKIRVYGAIASAAACDVIIDVYDCISDSKVVSTTVEAGDTSFDFYVVAGKYTVEFKGSGISTKSVTIEVPSGVTSFDMTS